MLSEYVFGVGEVETMGNILCLFITKKSHWEEKHCMDDIFYDDVNDALATYKLYPEAENFYSRYNDAEIYGPPDTAEDLKKIAEAEGMVHCQEFESYVMVCDSDDLDDDF